MTLIKLIYFRSLNLKELRTSNSPRSRPEFKAKQRRRADRDEFIGDYGLPVRQPDERALNKHERGRPRHIHMQQQLARGGGQQLERANTAAVSVASQIHIGQQQFPVDVPCE